MASIRGRDTQPEMAVRRALHAAGLRYRLHMSRLPGRPDIVLPKHRAVIFVHGCFWHRHDGCRLATSPATRPEFWAAKFESNVRRDSEASARLQEAGWRVATAWECGIRSEYDMLIARLVDWVRSDARTIELPAEPRTA